MGSEMCIRDSSGAEKNRKMMPLTWKISWKVAPEIRGFWPENEGKMRPQSWNFFLQRGHTESMVPGADKNWKMMPLTWKKSWKVAPEIRVFWPENEGKMRPQSWNVFLQIGHTESMVSGAEKNLKMRPQSCNFFCR